MNPSPRPLTTCGALLFALGGALGLAACGDKPSVTTGSTGPAPSSSSSVDYAAIDTRNPEQVASAMASLGIDPPSLERPALERGKPAAAVPIWPLGEVRKEGLVSFRIDLDPAAFATASTEGAVVRFRDGDKVLAQVPFQPRGGYVVDALPPEVLTAAKKGNELTWGLVLADRKRKPLEGTFKVVEKAAANRKVADLDTDARLARTPVFRDLSKAQVLENYSLFAEALPLYVDLSARKETDATGAFGVVRCLQRLASNQKHLSLKETGLFVEALAHMDPVKGTGASSGTTGSGGTNLPGGGGGGGIDAGLPTPAPGSRLPTPEAGGTTPKPPVTPPAPVPGGAEPTTPPTPAGGTEADAVARSSRVLAEYLARLEQRAKAEGATAEELKKHSEERAAEAKTRTAESEEAKKRLDEAEAKAYPPGVEALKALKEAASRSREAADAAQAAARKAEEESTAASQRLAQAHKEAEEGALALRRLRNEPEGAPGIPSTGPARSPLYDTLKALQRAQQDAQATADAAAAALTRARQREQVDPSLANVEATAKARAEAEAAQRALEEANQASEALRKAVQAQDPK